MIEIVFQHDFPRLTNSIRVPKAGTSIRRRMGNNFEWKMKLF